MQPVTSKPTSLSLTIPVSPVVDPTSDPEETLGCNTGAEVESLMLKSFGI